MGFTGSTVRYPAGRCRGDPDVDVVDVGGENRPCKFEAASLAQAAGDEKGGKDMTLRSSSFIYRRIDYRRRPSRSNWARGNPYFLPVAS